MQRKVTLEYRKCPVEQKLKLVTVGVAAVVDAINIYNCTKK